MASNQGAANMSAFIVDDQHINYLMTASITLGMQYADTATAKGKMLLEENSRCVARRYSNEFDSDAAAYRFVEHTDVATGGYLNNVAQIFAALDCYEYQCCDSKEFYRSEAFDFCTTLRKLACKKVAGYGAAAYEIV